MGIAPNHFFCHVDGYLDYRQEVYETSVQTIRTNRIDLGLFEEFVREKSIRTIDGPAVIDFQRHLKNHRQNCGASVNRKIFTLRSYGNFLKLWGVPHADSLPFYDVLKIRQGYRKRPNALTPGQIRHLFNAIDGQSVLGIRNYAVYALMYQLGLRVGEVHAIDLSDIDFESSRLEVRGKGNKPRTLHINNELSEILCHYISLREQFLNSHLIPALFISKKGNRLAIRTMEDNFKNLVSKTIIKVPFNVTCHTLRHSMASHLNDKNVDILVIQSILGHSTTRSTEPYIHPSLDSVRKAMEKLPGVKYVNELIKKGEIVLRFQEPFKPKLE
jgi:site-specific recombinase XerD